MSALEGLKVLVVEDEPIVAMMLEDMLDELGCELVGSAPTIEEGLRLVALGGFEVALLDVNLNGRRSDPVADALAQEGTPYLYATGYGASAVERDPGAIVLQKPYTMSQLAGALEQASGRG